MSFGRAVVPAGTPARPVEDLHGLLDDLLGGGLEHGTTCLLIGPAGAGKSTLLAVYAHAVARAGGSGSTFLL
ncbi:AAA family ATPase [Sorangium cellulosum]|uniref:AAA family ATPase n=1 Tax=Sorangium cellulosum TaxID=56 RepID=UPI000CF4105B|nr:ATP-binding cassette domain-containing protein [Sorangium cellulosum]